MMSLKMATPGPLKITVFWNKGYNLIIPVDGVINKILSCDSNYIVDVFMWPKFGNCSISMREVQFTNHNLNFIRVTRKITFFKGWSWFKFNNLGLTLGTNLKFHTSVAKGWKLQVRKFWGLIPTFVEVTGEKLVGGVLFAHPHPE